MGIEELIGKAITNIYCLSGLQDNWLDTAECFVELNGDLIIDIPYGESKTVWIKELNKDASSIFKDLLDHYPVFHVNEERKSIEEIAGAHKKRRRNILDRIRELLSGREIGIPEYRPHKIEYRENKLKSILNRKIINFLWYDDESEKGFLELDNECFISETMMSPSGTGQAGLNCYFSLNDLVRVKGDNFKKLIGN